MLQKYFPDMSLAERAIYTTKLNREKYDYLDMIEAFFSGYPGSEADFEQRFGFPMFIAQDNDDEYDEYEYDDEAYNSKTLLVDMYASVDSKTLSSAQIAADYKDFRTVMAKENSPKDIEDRFTRYLQDHGMNVSFEYGIKPSIENYNTYKDQGLVLLKLKPVIVEDYEGKEKLLNDEMQIVAIKGVSKNDRLYFFDLWQTECYVNLDSYANNSDVADFTMQLVKIDYGSQ
jgi:hypothetical protein